MAPRKGRPRGAIDRLPSGRFRARLYAGLDPLTKNRRYLSETSDTRSGAQAALTRLQKQVDERHRPCATATVSQVIERWLEVAQLEDSTRDDYDDLIRLYITPTFGAMPAAKLDAEMLERFYARLLRCSRLCAATTPRGHTCTPLSANRVRKIHFVLRAALDRAVRWRYLSVNEAATARPPAFERSEPDPPSAVEVARLLHEAAADPQWQLLLWLTMVTGCRRGEICALRWTDVDLDAAVISIERSYSTTRSSAREKPTKTRQKRRIAIDPDTIALLRSHRQQCRDNCAALDLPLAGDAFVFSNAPDGTCPLRPHSVSARYRRLARKLGLRSTRLHALRHYTATELLAQGVDLRTVAGRLGHSNGPATTAGTYAAWVDQADRHAADTLAAHVPRPDHTRRTPRGTYETIAAELRVAIGEGGYGEGDELPTVTELAATHGVSVGTASRAMTLLRTEGLINVARGRRATVR